MEKKETRTVIVKEIAHAKNTSDKCNERSARRIPSIKVAGLDTAYPRCPTPFWKSGIEINKWTKAST